ncbi:MAG: hypothetical protein IIC60_09555 [Proteobacteria bacterium]|nr:hypothetical protein [Pseudomonadota bacterium]
MIKLFIFSLLAIVLALLITLTLGFPRDPGYLLIAFGDYTFETSLFALIAALVVVYLVIRLILLVLHWINPMQLVRLGRNYNKLRKTKARSNTIEGLLCFTRGNWQSSYNLLIKSTQDEDASVINYLAAAFAAHQLDDKGSWIQCLEKAEQEYPAARSTVNSLKARLLFKSEQLEQCMAILEQLKKNSLNDAPLLRLLKDVYVRLEDWEQLRALLPALEKNKVVDQEELERIQMRVFMEELYAIVSKGKTNSDSPQAIIDLGKLWKKAPGEYREDEKMVRHYSELLLELNAKTEAARAIELALAKKWSDALVLCYGEQDFSRHPQQLTQAENWLKSRPTNASLLLSLGRICMRNELWGKAREYYQASIKTAPSAEAYAELSRLLKNLGESEASETSLKNYGDLIGAKLPELPMPSE